MRLLRPIAPLAGLLAALALIAPAAATADSSNTLTVVGTSDVSDSGLIPNLIQPEFEKAYPQFTFKYIGTATGTAIADAESGSVGASALIVHAASLENQFVANGYSYEKYGRAIWTNDFVLAGSTADPAGVLANAPHDIVAAFERVAAAGIAGNATFVSRGGTPGTSVEERSIWALVAKQPSPPAGLLLCAVSSTDGGGLNPIAAGEGVTADGQPCPNGGAIPTGSALPAWYVATGLTQGPNVSAANACTVGHSGANTCYVLTDRGTYDYLASGTDPAGSIPNLEIVTRDDSTTAPGGQYFLTNYFHAYIINPAKPGETVNLTAAQDFLNFITSPTVQSQLATYLAHTSDPGGAPFHADASPIITAKFPKSFRGGHRATVTGTVVNAEPGYPALADKPVTVDEIVGTVPVPVATGHTSSTGSFSIRFTPPATGDYEISTPQIAQIENATLSPVFGDLLSPGSSAAAKITVRSAVTKLSAASLGGRALATGAVSPAAASGKATVTVDARRAGTGKYRKVATDRLHAGDANFALDAPLGPGTWQVKVAYADRGQVTAAHSKVVKVTVGAASADHVTLGSVKVRHGRVAVTAKLSPAAPAGARVELLALRTSAGARDRFVRVAGGSTRSGVRTVSLHATLKRGYRWVLEISYTAAGQPSSFSKLRAVSVR